MADVTCPVCGEPWENDSLHEYAEEAGVTYKDVYKAFFSDGCGDAFSEWSLGPCQRSEDAGMRKRAFYSSMLAEILGDDVDGIMSSMDDAEYLGLL